MGAIRRPPVLNANNLPRQCQDSLRRWSSTYSRQGGADALPHVVRVLEEAVAHKMLELHKIGDTKNDPKQLNLKLWNVICAHSFRRYKDVVREFPTEDFARYTHVSKGFDVFDRLRENDLGLQDRHIYSEILAKPSLGLLARMVDLTQYGTSPGETESRLSMLNPARFYVYDSTRSKTEYELIALAAKNIYSPLADLLGYRKLAGDLYLIYYYHADREVYDKVRNSMHEMHSRIGQTKIVREFVIELLRSELQSQGYSFTIKERGQKHIGKVMEKADRKSREVVGSIEQQVYDLHDHVAFTVILHSKNGRRITQNDVDDYANVAELIERYTRSLLPVKSAEKLDMVSNPKKNGYQSFHIDLVFQDQAYASMEAIVRNAEMEEYSENGGAAHWLYKGGGKLARTVYSAYRNVVKGIEDNGSSILERGSHSTMRKIRVSVEGKTSMERIVDDRACVAEALLSAGVDLTNGLIVVPKLSLMAPITGIEELHLAHSREKSAMLEPRILKILISTVRDEGAREKLRGYWRLANRQ